MYKPGESGNPAGRPKGCLNKRTLVRQAIEQSFDKGEQGFWLAVAVQAKEGDSTALSMLAARLAPPYRPTAHEVEFELSDGDLYQKAESVLEAISAGQLPPDLGVNLIQAINATAKAMETIDLENRIAKLESMKV